MRQAKEISLNKNSNSIYEEDQNELEYKENSTNNEETNFALTANQDKGFYN